MSVGRIPAETELKPAASRSIYGKNYAHPTGFENDGLNLYVDAYAYSPDGEWAAMESKHIYSVHDVVVFSKE
ncbi:MAG: hypothetical protein ACPGWR_30805 [Ardenticatenaceae bacterium]